MPIYLNDAANRNTLLPFTHTRHAADIRMGIFTIREKWELLTGDTVEFTDNEDAISTEFIPCLEDYLQIQHAAITDDIRRFQYPWQIFQWNAWAIQRDVDIILERRVPKGNLSETNKCIKPERIFIEEGAKVEHCFLNATDGPIYIGANAEMMEGSMIRGPVAICNHAVVKMGTTIYPGTTIGPHCVVGGEIKNSMLMGYSNKGHHGYLGDSVIGEWCNLGAGTSNSNVKNNASDVVYRLPFLNEPMNVGIKAGLIMGDYSKTAINTSINTGTVVGVCCNIFAAHFPDKYIKDFSWGDGVYDLDRALNHIRTWKAMKGQILTNEEIEKLSILYKKTIAS